MKTNFFEHITALGITADLKIVISFSAAGNLVVSVMLANEVLSDKAGKLVQPMIIRGTVTELDELFFDTITQPLQQTAQLFANMDEYQKGLDAAKLASKQEQDKKDKKNKNSKAKTVAGAGDDDQDDDAGDLFSNSEAEEQQKADKKKAYEDAMKQVAELNGQMKYEEALALIPAEAEYPDKKEEITRKRAELNKRKETLAALKLDL